MPNSWRIAVITLLNGFLSIRYILVMRCKWGSKSLPEPAWALGRRRGTVLGAMPQQPMLFSCDCKTKIVSLGVGGVYIYAADALAVIEANKMSEASIPHSRPCGKRCIIATSRRTRIGHAVPNSGPLTEVAPIVHEIYSAKVQT